MGKKLLKVNNVNIYDIDYLMNTEFDEEDLHNIFDTSSLSFSLLLNMFWFMHDKRDNDEIINMCTRDNKWVYNNFWTRKQREQYTKKIANVYRNVYQYGPANSRRAAEQWINFFGFTIK